MYRPINKMCVTEIVSIRDEAALEKIVCSSAKAEHCYAAAKKLIPSIRRMKVYRVFCDRFPNDKEHQIKLLEEMRNQGYTVGLVDALTVFLCDERYADRAVDLLKAICKETEGGGSG